MTLFADEWEQAVVTPAPDVPVEHSPNPCVQLYGPGPEGQTCKDCIHLRYPIQRNPKQKYWKCDLRRLSHGSATDHHVGYPACSRYEARREEYHGG